MNGDDETQAADTAGPTFRVLDWTGVSVDGSPIDFPRAWQLARASKDAEHDPRCSWIVGEHGLLCDCHVLTAHPEYEQNTTVDGEPYVPAVHVRPKAEPWPEETDA